MQKIKQKIEELLEKAKKDKEILAVIIFGSFARGEKFEDIDVCLVMGKNYDLVKAGKMRIELSSLSDKFDVHIFQQMPLYVRARIFREGKLIFCRDRGALFDVSFETAREYEDFKPIYYSQIGATMDSVPAGDVYLIRK